MVMGGWSATDGTGTDDQPPSARNAQERRLPHRAGREDRGRDAVGDTDAPPTYARYVRAQNRLYVLSIKHGNARDRVRACEDERDACKRVLENMVSAESALGT